MAVNTAWEELLNVGVSEQTLDIVTSINGYSIEALQNVLYVCTGYPDFEEYLEEE